MNEITCFNNKNFGEVRGLLLDNEPWFIGSDIARSLGYSNAAKAVQVHVDDEDKKYPKLGGLHGKNPVLINESGMYSLILASKLPKAKEFKHWVTSEVLPSIRKSGAYEMTCDNNNSSIIQQVLVQQSELIKQQSEIIAMLKQDRNKRHSDKRNNYMPDRRHAEEHIRIDILKLVRAYGASIDNFAFGWNIYRKNLLYFGHMNIQSRLNHYRNSGKTGGTIMKMIKPNELNIAKNVAMNLCRDNGLNPEEILRE